MASISDCRRRCVWAGVVAIIALGGRIAVADFVFGPAENLGPALNTADNDALPTISPDHLSFWFRRAGEWWLATRATTDDPWDAPVKHGPWSDSDWNLIDVWLRVTTADGLELYFSEGDREGGFGDSDLWVRKRQSRDSEWGPPTNLGPTVNTSAVEMWPTLSPDGLEIYFSGYSSANPRPGSYGSADLWVTRRATRSDQWTEPANLGPVINTSSQDARPCISADGLVLLFDSQRDGGYGSADLHMVRRKSLSDPWGPPMNLGPLVNSPGFDECAYVAADGSTLYWDSNRADGHGGFDVWQAPIIPIVDFNGDGEVAGFEVCRIADHFGQDDCLCDVGPMPWGDGVVDLEDLVILARYIGDDVVDPTLLSHLALDEAEGTVAHDSGAADDATVLGEPVWQPDAGVIGGALEFDGIDDVVVADGVLSPRDGPFSALAWVKGGAAGQVIISQQSGDNWLMADASQAALMTELQIGDRFSGPLYSDAVITDNNWHRIAFTWDGENRRLYVDDILVAEDTQVALQAASGRLLIGCGANMTEGTLWAGLIDDVRIYNRAVKP